MDGPSFLVLTEKKIKALAVGLDFLKILKAVGLNFLMTEKKINAVGLDFLIILKAVGLIL